MTAGTASAIIRRILEEDTLMPKKYQNGKLEVRKDVAPIISSARA